MTCSRGSERSCWRSKLAHAWAPHTTDQDDKMLSIEVEADKVYRIEIKEVIRQDRSKELIQATAKIKQGMKPDEIKKFFDLVDDHFGRTK